MRSKKTYYFLVIVILIVSFSVRYASANSPQYVDENTYLTLANSLKNGHLAAQSSYWTVYNSTGATLTWGNYGPTVEPWFDHPPFFAILDIPFLILGFPRLLPIIIRCPFYSSNNVFTKK